MKSRKLSSSKINNRYPDNKSFVNELQDMDYACIDFKEKIYDLDLCINNKDKAFLSECTISPRRQSIDEVSQIEDLKQLYPGVEQLPKCGTGTIYLYDGKLYCSNRPHYKAVQLDGIDEHNNHNLITAKTVKVDGTSQHHQFKDIIEAIENAPDITSSYKLIVYLDGNFWVKKRNEYKAFEQPLNQSSFSLIDVLNHFAKNKSCVILHKDNINSYKNRAA